MSLSKRKILIVDDEEINLKVIEILIGNKNFKIYKALSGKEAFSIIEKEYFDIVISDLNMPNGDGFYLCRKIRENNIKIGKLIAFSNNISKKEECLECGFDYFINKLSAKKELLELLK